MARDPILTSIQFARPGARPLTLRRGDVVYEDGEILAGAGSGELLRRGKWQAP